MLMMLLHMQRYYTVYQRQWEKPFYCYYKTKFEIPEDEHKTAEDKPTFNRLKLNAKQSNVQMETGDIVQMKKKQDMMQPLQRTGLKQFQHHQQKQRRHLANKIIKGTA